VQITIAITMEQLRRDGCMICYWDMLMDHRLELQVAKTDYGIKNIKHVLYFNKNTKT